MYSLFSQLEASVKVSVEKGEYSGALDSLKQFVVMIMNEQSAPGEVVGARKVDELCELIGATYFDRQFQEKSGLPAYEAQDGRMVIICTGLYKYGGTTLVMSDLARAHPGYECTVLATNLMDDMTPEDLELSRIDGSGAVVSISPPGNHEDKLKWLIERLLEISPSRIFLMNHHHDSVIVSAASPFVDKANVIFYHHADYNMCLGVHLKGAIHVDPHNVGFYNCRDKEGISDNAYIPMTVNDRKVTRIGESFIEGGELTTCSSGHYHKFRNFYLYPYPDMIAERLKLRGGKHIHIGGIPPEPLEVIRQTLTDHGVDASRFVHIPWTASFWKTLVDSKIDLFIGSFPIGGARTTIEAMGAAIPLLMPENYMSRFFSSRDIVYADAFLWKYPSDFSRIISELTAASLTMHSARSRAHYDIHYNRDSVDLEERINAICSCAPTPDPYQLYPYDPDQLDKLLHFDQVRALTTQYAIDKALVDLAEPTHANPVVSQEAIKAPRVGRIHGSLSAMLNKTIGSWIAARRGVPKEASHLSPDEQKLYQVIRSDPSSIGFDPEEYKRRNPDVEAEGIDPLIHFVQFGQYEGRITTLFLSRDWLIDMNESAGPDLNKTLLYLAQTRADRKRKKAAFFIYAWNAARRPDAYIREMVVSLAALGVNVDVYVGGHFAEAEGTKGFRPDLSKSDMGAFLRSQSYDFALSFNNALIMPETVEALSCTIVSVLVDSIHHLFDHTGEGLHHAFQLPIHAAPIYTSFVEDAEEIPGIRALATFLPPATRTERGEVGGNHQPMEISWIASMLGDYHLDSFMSRVGDEVPDGLKLIATCLKDIYQTGEISTAPASQAAAKTLCDWSHWDYPLLEMHLQEIVTNHMRLSAVERLAPLGLKIFGNIRWRSAMAMSPATIGAFQSGAFLRRHADLCAVYDQSKISINIPQVHAGTGMQYRVLDILASKSLLITQYVEGSDMERLFGADSPIVTFTDIDDLHAKCVYYLEHEDERLARVKACNAMVAKGFSFKERAMDYLKLSNPNIANQVDTEAGPGSVTLIWPEKVIDWVSQQVALAH